MLSISLSKIPITKEPETKTEFLVGLSRTPLSYDLPQSSISKENINLILNIKNTDFIGTSIELLKV